MNPILQMSALFLAQLAFGSAILMPFLSLREIGKSFHRFYYGFIVLLLALFLGCLYRLGQFNQNFAIITAMAAWIWLLSFTQTHTRLEDYLLWVYGVFSAVMLVLYPLNYLFQGADTGTLVLGLITQFVAAVFLAFGLLNMIFGHWYLVNRELNIKHLIATSRTLIFVTYTRLALSLLSIYFAAKTMAPDKFDRLVALEGHGIFFWARFLAGYGIPVLVVHLTYSSAKIGSNQSATGIMYAGTAFILMGELLNLYLFMLTGIYF